SGVAISASNAARSHGCGFVFMSHSPGERAVCARGECRADQKEWNGACGGRTRGSGEATPARHRILISADAVSFTRVAGSWVQEYSRTQREFQMKRREFVASSLAAAVACFSSRARAALPEDLSILSRTGKQLILTAAEVSELRA